MSLNNFTNSITQELINGNTGTNAIYPGRVIGAPYTFTYTTDPGNRVIRNTLVKDAPIVNIIPGKLRDFMSPILDNKNDASTKKEGENADAEAENKKSAEDIMSEEFDSTETDENGNTNKVYNEAAVEQKFKAWIMENINSKGDATDLRFQGFATAYSEYFSFVNTMISTLSLKMGVGGSKIFKVPKLEAEKMLFEEGFKSNKLQFYATNSTSGTLSFDNNYGDNAFESTMDKAKDSVANSLGVGGAVEAARDLSQANKKYHTKSDKTVSESIGLGADAMALASGSKKLFLKTWKDSSMSNSINLSFKFSTPYGDRESIFDKVYLPFIMLLCLALPKQTSGLTYTAPFILKVDCPGLFASSACGVTSFSYNIGGESQKFSNDGFPLEITVDMTIEDLYPAIMMTDDPRMLRFNHSLHMFLDTLAGVAITDFQPFRSINETILIKTNSMAYLPERFGNRIKESLVDSATSFFKGYTHGNGGN